MASALELDGHKLLYHLDPLQKWEKGEEFFPPYLSLSLTDACNHDCVFCAYPETGHPKSFFPENRLPSLLSEWTTNGLKAILISGNGEPLLHPNATDIMEQIANAGIKVALNTNGSLLKKPISSRLVRSLSWIRISVNGGDPATYAAVHRTHADQFNEVMTNISTLVQAKKETNSQITIGIQSLLLQQNKNTLLGLGQRLKELQVDYFAIKPCLEHPANPYQGGDYEIGRIEGSLKELSTHNFVCRIRKTFDTAKRNYSHCYGHRFAAELDSEGNLYACGPLLGNSDFFFGNVFESSFFDVWKSEKRKRVCAKLEQTMDLNNCMPACRCDAMNRFLWELKNPPAHVNFI